MAGAKMNAVSEFELVAAACQGDTKALEHLFAENAPKLKRFVRSKIGNQEDIDDLVQDTFVQAQLSIKNFQGNSKFSTWLVGISYNIIRNYLSRSPHKKYNFVDDSHLDYVECSQQTPEQANDTSEFMGDLMKSLETLPADAQDMIIAVSVNAESYKDVARRHNCSVSALKSRIFRIRQSLRTQMQDHL